MRAKLTNTVREGAEGLNCPFGGKYLVEVRLRSLADNLINETDEEEFTEGKEELLELLDIMAHVYGTLDYHYENNIEIVRGRCSGIDAELMARILKGREWVAEQAKDRNVINFKRGLIKLAVLEEKQQNRIYGILGIYGRWNYTNTKN